MRAFFGVIYYILHIPVILWIYYRCLETEVQIWKRGKYGLLIFQVFHALFSFYAFYAKENAGLAGSVGDSLNILTAVMFFLMVVLWAEKGIGAFLKTEFFLGIYWGLQRGIAGIIRGILKFGGLSFESREYFLLSLGAVLVMVVVFVVGAWVLNKGLYEKIPGLLVQFLILVWLVYDLAVPFWQMGIAEKSGMKGLFLAMVFVLLGCLTGSLIYFQRQSIRRINYDRRQQDQLFLEYYTALDRQNTMARQMGHDMSNHLRVMKQLAEQNDREEMDILTGNLKEEYGKYQCPDLCSNRMVNALLYRKLEVCREKKIRTQIDLAQFEGGYIENTEWLCLFFNLFNNAIEACSKVEKGRERFIHVRAKCAGGFEVIVFQNSRNPGKTGLRRNTYERGLGLHILTEIAEKYGGTVICKEEKDTFQTTVSLQVREKRQETLL